jgi:hypothetical protein
MWSQCAFCHITYDPETLEGAYFTRQAREIQLRGGRQVVRYASRDKMQLLWM